MGNKSYTEIAEAMYHAYCKVAERLDEDGLIGHELQWDDLDEGTQRCWVEAARQAAAELALVPMSHAQQVSRKQALQTVADSIVEALRVCNVSDVLTVVTGCFVSLTIELLRRNGHDASKEICINGGQQRDITIHAEKVRIGSCDNSIAKTEVVQP